jgi:hypothetical protein
VDPFGKIKQHCRVAVTQLALKRIEVYLVACRSFVYRVGNNQCIREIPITRGKLIKCCVPIGVADYTTAMRHNKPRTFLGVGKVYILKRLASKAKEAYLSKLLPMILIAQRAAS